MRNTLMDHFPGIEQALLGEDFEEQLHLPTDVRRLIVSILATPHLAENGDLVVTKTSG